MKYEIFYYIAALFGYLIGSIPFGFLICSYFGIGDIRTKGSGNIGATNVLRVGRKDLAVLTLILDVGKAIFAYIIIGKILPVAIDDSLALVAGVSAVLGHCFPIWLRFRGGKGFASSLGVYLISSFSSGVFACIVWLATSIITGYSSLSAIAVLILVPIYAYIYVGNYHFYAFLFLSFLGLIRHKSNIKNLLHNQEDKIGSKK